MDTDIIVALIAFLGTAAGTLGGIVASARLTTYRLKQLEQRVAEHNNFARRMPVVEEAITELRDIAQANQTATKKQPVIEEQIKVINHRLADLERYHANY